MIDLGLSENPQYIAGLNLNEKMMMPLRPLLLFIALLLLASCSTYKLDVQQGNIVTQEQLEQLTEGMTPREVQHVMGSPLVKDPFHTDRWDYFFSLKKGKESERKQHHVTIFFKDGKLHDIDGKLDPEAVAAAGESITASQSADEDNFFVRLWKKLRPDE